MRRLFGMHGNVDASIKHPFQWKQCRWSQGERSCFLISDFQTTNTDWRSACKHCFQQDTYLSDPFHAGPNFKTRRIRSFSRCGWLDSARNYNAQCERKRNSILIISHGYIQCSSSVRQKNWQDSNFRNIWLFRMVLTKSTLNYKMNFPHPLCRNLRNFVQDFGTRISFARKFIFWEDMKHNSASIKSDFYHWYLEIWDLNFEIELWIQINAKVENSTRNIFLIIHRFLM